MIEVELKFQLPENKKKSVLQALKAKTAEKIRLQAKYYDTPDRLLAQQHVALRLRLEGQEWVQTFKASGKTHLERIECEVKIGKSNAEPEIDLSLFQAYPEVMQRLQAVLGDQAKTLCMQFKTDVQRTYRVVEVDGTHIEICLDDGEVSTPERAEKICEVEFELKSGSAETLILFTQEWVKKYKLWLDVRSKAERGNLLATNQKTSPATKAKALVLDKKMSNDMALRQMIGNALAQLLPNAAFIAEGIAAPEHIHQARVAIRRMRSALKTFGRWSSDVDTSWEAALGDLQRELGVSRDQDVLRDEILPKLVESGAPFKSLPKEKYGQLKAYQTFEKPEHVCLLLQLLAFSIHNDKSSKKKNLKKQASDTLDRLLKKIIQDASKFASLKTEQRHRLRKRAKRLRYSIEFVSGLYKSKRVSRYLSQLQSIQEILGEYNDMHMTETYFEALTAEDPTYWFAVGWSRGQQSQLIKDASEQLERFRQQPSFWKTK